MSQPAKPTVADRLSTGILRLMPQHLLAAGMYRLTRSRVSWLKRLLISQVVRRYRVDLDEAAQPDPDAYPTFNSFFTRALREGARPVAREHIVSPADGRVSQAGRLDGEQILQAKGHYFTLPELLAGDSERVSAFRDGLWATIYLSPRDYHRVHLPLAGRLGSMVFVPGSLFSVSDATAQLVPGLFARNERVLCHFDTEFGPMTVVLVGAIFVGSIETVWHGEVRGGRGHPTRWDYVGEDARQFATGDEIGRFNMGSTVIVLLPPGVAEWSREIVPGQAVRVGQPLGVPLLSAGAR